MKIKASNLTINVSNMDQSIAFYESIGFDLKQRWDNHYAQLMATGITIGLHPSSQAQKQSGGLSIGFTVEDFQSSRDELKQLNIAFTERTEEGGDFLHFNDPDGTALYIINSRW